MFLYRVRILITFYFKALKDYFYNQKDLLFFFSKIKNIYTIKKNQAILFDHFNVTNFQLIRLIFLIFLAKFYNSKIVCFNYKFNIFFYKIYKFLNIEVINYNNYFISKKYNSLVNKTYYRVLKNIKNKNDVFNIRLFGLDIGIDIYETYLLRFREPTLEFENKKFKILLKKTIEQLYFWKLFFKKYDVKALNISHRDYTDTNIVCKIAYQKKIKVYTFGGQLTRISRFLNSDRDLCRFYKKYFDNLSQKKKNEAIKLSKKRLSLRFKGKVGVDMNYSTKSAFHDNYSNQSILFNKVSSNNIKVLICTHCFYDNPHAYGGNLFLDFYEWLLFLGKASEKTNYDWYIKPHPDYLPGTIEIIKSIINKFPKIKLIPPETSFFYLKQIGINFALTVYGSVAHELPFLGIDVINADKFNPHCSFNFSYTPKNIKDYEKVILNLNNYKSLIKNKNDIYKFYYIYHYFIHKKNIFFKNDKLFLYNYNKDKTYFIKYFIKDISNNRLKIIERNLFSYFSSKNKYLINSYAQKIAQKFEKLQ